MRLPSLLQSEAGPKLMLWPKAASSVKLWLRARPEAAPEAKLLSKTGPDNAKMRPKPMMRPKAKVRPKAKLWPKAVMKPKTKLRLKAKLWSKAMIKPKANNGKLFLCTAFVFLC